MLAHAGSFSISPLRAELGDKPRSASFTVTNGAAEHASFQVSVRKWTQGADGKDVYEESGDLVVFPRQLEVPAMGKRIVRVGIEHPPAQVEAAYRVFIEELPPAASATAGRKGTVAVVGRFALPVFVKTASARGQLAIDSVNAKEGTYTVRLANRGNARVHLARMTAGNSPDGAAQLASPYLLAGVAREVSGPLGPDCRPGATVKVAIATESGIKAEKELLLPPDACRG
jgi:fimbrial chaperone protein